MSVQNGSRSRSPSIIARLMGLDGLPPQSSPHREDKSVENQQRRPIRSEKALGKKTYGDHESSSRGLMDEQRFKDVFEVLDAEKESRSLHQRRVNANLTEAEMAFIRQKFMEAKRLSTDEKLRYSKEFNETLEALDSNKDLLLKFIHHPDSLFTEHLPDLQSIAPKPHCSQATTLKLSNSPNHVDNVRTLKVDRELVGRSHRSHQWHGGGANPCHSNTRSVPYDDTVDLSKKQRKKRSGLKPTEIVVLKPNLGKSQTTGRTLPSQSSSSDEVRADRRLPCTSNQESKAFGGLKAKEDVTILRHKPRDPRAIARIVSRQMKASCGNSMNFEISRFRGYAGDESSSGSDSSSESKLVSVISGARTDVARKKQRRYLPSRSPESSVSKEAMRRLSERWKMAHKSEREIEIRRRNTLAEMLATSDRESRPAGFDGITFEEGIGKRLECNVGPSELPEPIRISSRDGWKGTGRRNLSKPRTIMHEDRTCGYTIVLPKKLITRDELEKGSCFHHREYFFSNNSTPFSVSSQFPDSSSSEINRPSSSKILQVDGELSEDKLPSIKTVNADSENGSYYEDAKSTPSLESLHLSEVTSLTDHDISGSLTEEVDHSSIPQLQPQESAEEGNQLSPVSILQTSSHDEFSSSSECFESLSADLQGLRMQLQQLKRESGTYNEDPMLISSDEDSNQDESSIVTDKTVITQEPGEDWKSLYLADVLANCKFSDLSPQSFVETWHSFESPVDPSLFENLEKKYTYSSLKTSSRLERKLLFDRINSEILEFFEQFKDLQPTKVCPKWEINKIQETLREMVTIKFMKPSRETKEKRLQWPSLEDDIEVIGKEIEEMLTDGLIAELVI
ncbi:hypothetical protein EUTSA_v10016240mg [Eutrema salsugineum]|uniref:DUF4378 domain-containing protein n=2 Tax=Eutrema salsugineum TaxID=72664 RepID=V4LP70_EUTSA|nr:hypothetical protein EUTSA_v10016240mg [Eutrema salsugineum]